MPNYTEVKLYKGQETILFDESVDVNGKKRHTYYRLDEAGKKKRLCGVTTYLGVMDKPALIPWAVKTTVDYIRKNIDRIQDDPKKLLDDAKAEAERQKDIAGEIGSAIHAWISDHIKGNKPEMPEDDRVAKGVINFIDWVQTNNVEFLESERIVYSRKHGYVGTLDLLFKIDGKLYLGDIKTGNAIYEEAFAQTSAYLKAYHEETNLPIVNRMIIRISKESEEEYKARMAEKGKTDYPEYKIFEAVEVPVERLQDDFDAFLACMKIYKWKKI